MNIRFSAHLSSGEHLRRCVRIAYTASGWIRRLLGLVAVFGLILGQAGANTGWCRVWSGGSYVTYGFFASSFKPAGKPWRAPVMARKVLHGNGQKSNIRGVFAGWRRVGGVWALDR